jgi:aminopeptidase N
MELFDSLYGSYPFDRYGQDVVYPFAWGGMEHQELSTIHRNWVTGISEGGMAHELAHMWWGDMVTCVDFREIWLNEGCATYSDANYNWIRWGHADFISTMQSRAQSYFQADASWRHPIYDPPSGQMFNYGHTYCKASWVMHMLRFLDQANFFVGMRAYRDSLEYGCASTEDLKTIFSQVYGTDLTWFFDEWVYDQGHPEYDIYWICNPSASDYLFRTNIYQVQTNAPPVFHMPVQIMLHMTSGDTLVNIPVNTSPEHFQVLVSDSVTSIDFDPNTWLLHRHNIFVGIEEVVSSKPVFSNIYFSSNPTRTPEINYVINQKSELDISLYDVNGRIVRKIFRGQRVPGAYSIRVSNLSAGVYFCRLKTPASERIEKLVVIH